MNQKLSYTSQPYGDVVKQAASSPTDPLVVDLGYSIFQGFHNSSTNLNTWNGIRFAADAGGSNRWQPPKVPEVDRSSVKIANEYGSNCPQASNSLGAPKATGVTGNEDCLFLNVIAPANAAGLPVLVWIHGGGYGAGDGSADLSTIITTNQGRFIGVSIQYRLGAFGFLSSEDIMQHGVVNAGLLDQILALQWIQAYISKFGGNPSKVTIAGESAGAGAVMLLDMAYGGTLTSSLFTGSIAASPYLPVQHYYNASYPSYQYQRLAQYSNCPTYSNNTFDCLVSSSTRTLQNANSYVSTDTTFGTWAFVPVTDGILVQDQPAAQLQAGRLNGNSMLTGSNAIEAYGFTPANISTEAQLKMYVETVYPRLGQTAIQRILDMNPSSSQPDNPNATLFATDGINQPSAINQSSLATGQQQRAYNIYAEATFVCPSYWLAQAYANSANRRGYKYQYSIVPGTHGSDVAAYLDPSSVENPPSFALAISTAFGNFISTADPAITSSIAIGIDKNNSQSGQGQLAWGTFSATSSTNATASNNITTVSYPMLNFNTSYLPGAEPRISISSGFLSTTYPPTNETRNNISIVNGWTWEDGRGARCEIWRNLTIAAAGGKDDRLNQTLFPLPPLHHTLTEDAKIGIGVGVGVGVPLVILVMFCIWQFRRGHGRVAANVPSETTTAGTG